VIKKRILASLSSNFLGQVITIFIQLVSIPILISEWGTQYYGEWMALFALPSYIAMSDIGMGVVANTEINTLISNDNVGNARKIFNQSFNLILKIGIIPLFIFVMLVFVPSFFATLNIQSISYQEFISTAILLFLYGYWALVISLPQGLYRSISLYARGQYISNIFRVLEFGAFIISVLNGAGMFIAACIFLGTRILQSFFIYYDLKKLTSVIDFSLSHINLSHIKHLIKPSLAMIGLSLGQNFLVQGMVIIINMTLGGASVAVFTTIRTLCNFAKQLIGIINLAFWGEFTTAYAQKNLVLSKKLLSRAEQMVWGVSLLSTIFLYFAGEKIISFWTKNQIFIEEPFYTLFLLTILFNSVWYVRYTFLLAINQHSKLTLPYLLASIIVLIISFIFVDGNGLWVSALSLLLIDVLMAPLVFKTSFMVLKNNFLKP
jgi:O-antigen/teichoic acid export membrane protein